MFNKHYVNIVEKPSGIAQKSLKNSLDQNSMKKIFVKSLKCIGIIPASWKHKKVFPKASIEDIPKIIKSLNSNKAAGSDRIPLKLTKAVANVIDSHLQYTINKDLKKNEFSENAKTTFRSPIYKKNDRPDQLVF